mmetsp:Transcript_24741/g.54011  ORF Transcript_24741/g.54011 Transcript_24741/m.54011 type:complete len:222 (-) Transcript_24741:731-1396(-)
MDSIRNTVLRGLSLQSLTEWSHSTSPSERRDRVPTDHMFYLNVTVGPTAELHKRKVAAKVPLLEQPVASAYSATLSRTSGSSSSLAQQLSEKVAETIPTTLAGMGIDAMAELKLMHGPFFVIKVTVRDVDAQEILRKIGESHPRQSKVASCLLRCLPQEAQQRLEAGIFSAQAAERLAHTLGPGMASEVADVGVELKADGVFFADEGDYLMRKLVELKAQY